MIGSGAFRVPAAYADTACPLVAKLYGRLEVMLACGRYKYLGAQLELSELAFIWFLRNRVHFIKNFLCPF